MPLGIHGPSGRIRLAGCAVGYRGLASGPISCSENRLTDSGPGGFLALPIQPFHTVEIFWVFCMELPGGQRGGHTAGRFPYRVFWVPRFQLNFIGTLGSPIPEYRGQAHGPRFPSREH